MNAKAAQALETLKVPTTAVRVKAKAAGTPTTRRAALDAADAIMALEGLEKHPELAPLEDAIVSGEVSFDDAAKAIMKRAKERAQAGDA